MPNALVRTLVVLAAQISLCVPAAGAGQSSASAADATAVLADSLMYVEGDAPGALDLLRSGLSAAPDDYELLWRAARAATALGVIREGQEAEAARDSLYQAAIELGRRAVAVRPNGVEGLYWEVAAKGRVSLHADSRQAAAYADEIDREARRIIEMDSLDAGGHNALGRLNMEVMILPGWKRTLGRMVSGDALGRMSWDEAEAELQRAVELEPGNPLYLRDLGELHLRRGRPTAARVLLTRLVERTGLLPWDRVFQDEAREMLSEIGDGSR